MKVERDIDEPKNPYKIWKNYDHIKGVGNAKRLGTILGHVLTLRETKERKQKSKRSSRLGCLSKQENPWKI